jgi:large subunit ribosomal protein L25
VAPVIIALDAHQAALILGRLTSSSLVTIDLDGKEYPSLVREKQRNHVRGNLIHVDFMAVSLTEKIHANVGIALSGLSPAVKDFNAVLVTGLDSLEVEAFPQDLPERVTVDISILANIGDAVHVRDIIVSDKVTVLTEPDGMIVLATAPKAEVEEEVAPEVEAVEEGAEPEVIEKGKKEEEETEEAGKAEKAGKTEKPEKK